MLQNRSFTAFRMTGGVEAPSQAIAKSKTFACKNITFALLWFCQQCSCWSVGNMKKEGVVSLATAVVKDANFNMRINKQKKSDLESLYSRLGMTLPEAVNIFFENSLLVGGLPFSVRLPRYNKETEDAMQEAKDITSGKVSAKSYSSAQELFDELDAE